MLCWTAITVLFVLHTGIQVVITRLFSTNCSEFTLSKIIHSISFCNFGHMCSFLSCLMPCDKTFVIFAIKFNSGYIFRKSTNKYRKLNSSHPKMTEINYGFIVSKETVVLRQWGRSKQKFGFIKRVDKC